MQLGPDPLGQDAAAPARPLGAQRPAQARHTPNKVQLKQSKDTQVKIMHTQDPTIYKTLQAINKLFYDHLECLSVIKACWAKLQHVALLEVGGGAGEAGEAAALPPRRCIIL